MDTLQYCPICKVEVQFSSRYPRHVCEDCVANAVSETRRALKFYDYPVYVGYYTDNHEEYVSHTCYIDGVKCRADAAHMGGIVLQPTEDPMLALLPLTFKPVLRLHEVDGENKDGPVVRYQVLDESFLATKRGVYVVTRNDDIVYCCKFTTTFSKRWLYAEGRYVYHFKRDVIAAAVLNGHDVAVHAQNEVVLREQLGYPGNEWISVSSIEEQLIRQLSLRRHWNSIG